MGFDVDDQGYVYIAATIYGWGILKDGLTSGNGSQMNSNGTPLPFPCQRTELNPNKILSVKGSSRYYAIVSSATKGGIYDVTDRTKPGSAPTVVPTIKASAKNAAGDRAAIVDTRGTITIAGGDGFASGSPLFTATGYNNVASDGTNFFGLKSGSSGLTIAVIVPNGPTGYTVQGEYSGRCSDGRHPTFTDRTVTSCSPVPMPVARGTSAS